MSWLKGQPIQKWKGKYTRVISYHLIGWSSIQIAKHLGLHVNTVSRIVNSAQGQKIIQESKDRILKSVEEEITPKKSYIESKAIKAIAEFVDNDELKEKAPFNYVDRMIKLASMGDARREEFNTTVQGNAFILNTSPELASQMLKALRESSQTQEEVKPESFDTTKKLKIVNE